MILDLILFITSTLNMFVYTWCGTLYDNACLDEVSASARTFIIDFLTNRLNTPSSDFFVQNFTNLSGFPLSEFISKNIPSIPDQRQTILEEALRQRPNYDGIAELAATCMAISICLVILVKIFGG